MSNKSQDWNDDEFDELDDDQYSETDLVKKLRKAERAKEKRIKELEAELNGVKSSQRENVIKSVLSDKGINPKVASFIPSEIEASSEAIDQWLNDYSDVFGIKREEKEDAPDLSTLRQIDAATANAMSPDKVEDVLSRISQAESAEDILNMIYSTPS
jgi:hypothetical protein